MVSQLKLKKHLPTKLQRRLKQEDSDVLTVEMLVEVAPTLARLERLSVKPFIAFFEPPSLDDRIMNQAAILSVSSSLPVLGGKTTLKVRLSVYE